MLNQGNIHHGKQVHREDDGAIEFWGIGGGLQKHFPYCPHWSDDRWKKSMAGGGHKKRLQYCADSSGAILYLRSLQGHSGRNLIDPSVQDNVVIPDGFFKYIYHVGCAINLHSIINSGLILGGQKLNNRQTVFFLLVDPMDKNHKDLDTIDLLEPRHKAWKRHQNAVYWVDINLALRKGLKFYQTRSNAIILHETLPAYCIPKVVRMETGEVIHEKVCASPRPPPKISLKHDWKRELGSEDAQRPEGQVVQQFKSSQSNQPIPNPDHNRTGQPVVRTDRKGQPVVGTNTRTAQDGRKTSRSQEIDTRSFHEEAVKNDRTGQPVVETHTDNVPDGSQKRSFHESIRFNVGEETIRDGTEQPVVNTDESSHEQTMLNEVNMDFRIPGLQHSVVQKAESSRFRELVKKIENHPDRHALQQDLQRNKACNPFSAKSKQMIQEMGNVELFELFETDLETQCKECLSYWNEGIVCCTCGHLLKESAANRGVIQHTLDVLSIPEYVIKKGRPHGHRCGKTPEKKEYHLVHNLKKRCIQRQFKGIHGRFLRDHVFRERMIQNNRDEDVCRAWDGLAEQDHTYRMSESEYVHYRQNCWITLNKSGNNTQPLRKRSDFNQALSALNRLHQEAGGQQLRPMPYWKYQQRQSSSSSSSTWWQWSGSWWSS